MSYNLPKKEILLTTLLRHGQTIALAYLSVGLKLVRPTTVEEIGDPVMLHDPTRLTDGIEPSDDPVLAVRRGVYEVSVAHRTGGWKGRLELWNELGHRFYFRTKHSVTKLIALALMNVKGRDNHESISALTIHIFGQIMNSLRGVRMSNRFGRSSIIQRK